MIIVLPFGERFLPDERKIKNDSIGLLFQQALDRKLASDLSKHHKNNLRYAFNHFMDFLGESGREMSIRELTTSKIEDSLFAIVVFKLSEPYYELRNTG
ncbi:hypothetical protein J3L18_24970 [Mucilaginibacter gossypii]|uniref:hypothetical protein n=1 Tax=Mucilaginibacter gossypii TaxID=551996 RepID=UPI000DCBAE9A|nr:MULTISPECIES: hypothetical protein [Mucilaginibacter]QTE36354.1 hypothetical protein J3L18_24970 [Mucilaginibacter gossypii]RAV60059.1 hypothetical protein DIU36_01830 [Mucilaginibacter rubeus]